MRDLKKIIRTYKGGNLNLSSCAASQFQDFPEVITGDLDLSNSQLLKHLPKQLKRVEGQLHLNGCKSLEFLPDNLTITGNLNAFGCDIKYLPDDISILGNIDLSFSGIKCLPAHLTDSPNRDILLLQCASLESLPEIVKARRLLIPGCTSMISLPRVLIVEHLNISECGAINTLPDTFKAKSVQFLDNFGLLSGVNAVCQSIHTMMKNNRSVMDGECSSAIKQWCKENDITITKKYVEIGPFLARLPIIEDDTEYMHYRLRWA